MHLYYDPRLFVSVAALCQGKMADSKSLYTGAFVLVLIPVIVEPINKIWHTGSYQALPRPVWIHLGAAGPLPGGAGFQRPVDPPCRRSLRPMDSRAVYSAGRCDFSPLFPFGNGTPKTLTVYTRTLWGNDQSLQIFLIFFLLTAGCCGLGLFLYRHRMLSRRLLAVVCAY